MAGVRRSDARIRGAALASAEVTKAGAAVRAARRRRSMKQAALAGRVGISQARLADIEAGRGGGAPMETWFALGQALGLYLKFEYGRDPQAELRDAGHLAIQELMLNATRDSGWQQMVEVLSRQHGSDRSIDVRLVHRSTRQLAIAECWNSFGDLGDGLRSSSRKLRDAQEQAVAIAGDGSPFDVGLVWIVRDTKANRELLHRYAATFATALPGSSEQWLDALTTAAPIPRQPGLVWCDVSASRLFARRAGRSAR